jgi:hypothetical protein
MNTHAIHFRCPHCRSRIKAPCQLIGQSRACPGCQQPFAVPGVMIEDAGPILVPIEDCDHYTLALMPRQRGFDPRHDAPSKAARREYQFVA